MYLIELCVIINRVTEYNLNVEYFDMEIISLIIYFKIIYSRLSLYFITDT
jgi:hypothetical protein